MLENVVGKRYAQALSGTVTENSRLEAVLENLHGLCAAFDTETRLKRFFANPSIAVERKSAMVQELCQKLKVHESVQRLMDLLALRKKILFLPKIAEFFRGEMDRRLNQVRALVTAAEPLEPDQKDKLAGVLNRALGKKVLIEVQVDPSLIGGLVLHVDGVVVDTSLSNRLARLKKIIEK
jgi:F-type H+-transporting ATPase subunit delta